MYVEHKFKLVSNTEYVSIERIKQLLADFKTALQTIAGPPGLEAITVNADAKSYCIKCFYHL